MDVAKQAVGGQPLDSLSEIRTDLLASHLFIIRQAVYELLQRRTWIVAINHSTSRIVKRNMGLSALMEVTK
jgi:hypothetical protein